jgi:glucose/mannose-6-phosphate isomerase
MGICASRTELRTLIPSLKVFRDSIVKNGDKNLAITIANAIMGRIPVIYSMVNLRAAAIRWKMQISENSRTLAFCCTIPEFSHNEIVGWMEDYASDEFISIILEDDDPIEMLKCMTETLSSVLESNGIKLYTFKVKGSNDLEKNLKAIMLGDFVSHYLAHLKGVCPCEIQLDLGSNGYREFN